MLLQTNSYVVPKDKRAEHARVLRKFRQVLARLGCDHFEVYEQVGPGWSNTKTTNRFVQIMQFRDREHHAQVQEAERADGDAQEAIREFCGLVNMDYQQDKGLFAAGFYVSALPVAAARAPSAAASGIVASVEPEPEAQATAEAQDSPPEPDQASAPEPDSTPTARARPKAEDDEELAAAGLTALGFESGDGNGQPVPTQPVEDVTPQPPGSTRA
jgi:hypothetical protein